VSRQRSPSSLGSAVRTRDEWATKSIDYILLVVKIPREPHIENVLRAKVMIRAGLRLVIVEPDQQRRAIVQFLRATCVRTGKQAEEFSACGRDAIRQVECPRSIRILIPEQAAALFSRRHTRAPRLNALDTRRNSVFTNKK